MKTSELINKLLDSFVNNGNLPTNVDSLCWSCPSEGGHFEKVILCENNNEEIKEEKKIPEKIKEDCFFDMVEQDGDSVKIPYLTKIDTLLIDKINEIITYLENKGE